MEKSYPASATKTHRGLSAWPFWEVFHGMPDFLKWNKSLLWALCWYNLPDVPHEWVAIICVSSMEVMLGRC